MSADLPTIPSVPAATGPGPGASILPPATATDGPAGAANEGPATSAESVPPAADVPPPDESAMIEALKEVIDPELMINIIDLGLVYSITLDERQVHVDMTLTSPACPAGPQIVSQSKMALERLGGVEKANIRLVMSPPWSPARMTDEARDLLGIF
jgi:metal-sulfur cluster biosynthetic enzyme